MFRQWSLRLRILLFFALLAGLCILAVALGVFVGYRQMADTTALPSLFTAGIVAAFVILGACTWIWLLFDEHVARPVIQLAAELRARSHAGVDAPLDPETACYLGDLAPAASALSGDLASSRQELDQLVRRETERMAAQNDRLEKVLRDVPVGVIVCADNHRIVLYNNSATQLLDGSGHLGLKRSIFEFLAEGPIQHACARLAKSGGRAVDLLCASHDGRRVFQGRMRRLAPAMRDAEAGGGEAGGYVLTIDDVTDGILVGANLDNLFRDALERLRRPAANLSTALDVLDGAGNAIPAEERRSLQVLLASEVDHLVAAIRQLGQDYDGAATSLWPMLPVSAFDLIDALRTRLQADGIELADIPDDAASDLTLTCDGFAIVLLLEGLVLALVEQGSGLFSVVITALDEGGADICLHFEGGMPDMQLLESCLGEPIAGGYGELTGEDVLLAHATELWPEATSSGHACLRLPIRRAMREQPAEELPPRPEFYDFALLESSEAALDDDRRLDDLTFVVFDSETTGLLPDRGDEMVQLAAVRVVNSRILQGETFDTLIDPGRPIPAASTRIHKIADADVQGAPGVADTVLRLHGYAAESILVAHNARFDMTFLHRREQELGVVFDQPVLDTVLLSAIVFGRHEDHTLDTLAERLDVHFAAGERHTALGDARVTAEVLIKLLPMLKAAGIETLGQTFQTARKFESMLKKVS